jgi:serine phosphatase RsbU (regulator of sigma subunit)
VHVWAAILLGGAITAVPVYLAITQPGRAQTRYAIAVGQMLTSALLIHLTGGRIETHFHVFGSLAFLMFYYDWRVVVIATATIAGDHLIRSLWWPLSVYGVAYGSLGRVFEHTFWVIFEDVVLLLACRGGLAQLREIALREAEVESSREALVVKQRLEREMEIAAKIQTAVLPKQLQVPGLAIAAQMIPASEVGGDYYDVLPVPGGCWIGIGDVSGHGVTSGLIMLMIQSAVAGLSRQSPSTAPRELLRVLNELLYENIRVRLSDDNHATLSLLRYYDDGRVVFAGAHEDIVICRPEGPCELVPTPGPWVGAMRNISRAAVDSVVELGAGDLMLLYTDGLTESVNAEGEPFGMERLCAVLEQSRRLPVEEIRLRLFAAVAAWSALQDDDRTVVIVRKE